MLLLCQHVTQIAQALKTLEGHKKKSHITEPIKIKQPMHLNLMLAACGDVWLPSI